MNTKIVTFNSKLKTPASDSMILYDTLQYRSFFGFPGHALANKLSRINDTIINKGISSCNTLTSLIWFASD